MQSFCKLVLGFSSILGLLACATPPREIRGQTQVLRAVPESERRMPLVDVRTALPDVVCELRYATAKNLTGALVYPADMPCLLNASTVEKLRRAEAALRAQGLGLKIWDAWRPGEIQVELYEASKNKSLFVDPREAWSKHCAGMAVDVTLVEGTGREARMPTDFDAGGPQAASVYTGRDPVVRQNLATLQWAMMQAGFKPIELEWWHFDDTDFNESAPPPPIFAADMGISLPSRRP